ncbi:S8 family serine peptidase [Rhodococcus hoagii]|nr:S8 family serine peptidase [Prescottella equi]
MSFDTVWPLTRGAGQTVAVIDTGVARHPRLPGLIPGGDYVSTGDGTGDCDAHGTIVAGLIAAAPTPTSGFAGGAPDARVMTIRQSSANFSETRRRDDPNDVQNTSGYGNTQTMAMAIRQAVDNGATVVNISEVACGRPPTASRTSRSAPRCTTRPP